MAPNGNTASLWTDPKRPGDSNQFVKRIIDVSIGETPEREGSGKTLVCRLAG
jgi:hypothetical protein